jgi:hypothetical protein
MRFDAEHTRYAERRVWRVYVLGVVITQVI